MENQENEVRQPPVPDIYEQEELCQKSIKAVTRALVMRVLVAVVLVASVAAFPMELWVWGLLLFVVLIDLLGAAPLVMELRKQRKRLKALIEMEED